MLLHLLPSGYTCKCNNGYYGNGTLGFCEPICLDESIYSDNTLTDFNSTTCRSLQPNRPDGGIIYTLTPNQNCHSESRISSFNVTLIFDKAQNCSDLNRVVYTSEPNDRLFVPNNFCGLKTTPCRVVTTSINSECSVSCECVNYPIPEEVCQILLVFPPDHDMMSSDLCDVTIG